MPQGKTEGGASDRGAGGQGPAGGPDGSLFSVYIAKKAALCPKRN